MMTSKSKIIFSKFALFNRGQPRFAQTKASTQLSTLQKLPLVWDLKRRHNQRFIAQFVFCFFSISTDRRNEIEPRFMRCYQAAFDRNNFITIEAYMTMQRAILYAITLSFLNVFLLFFACTLETRPMMS